MNGDRFFSVFIDDYYGDCSIGAFCTIDPEVGHCIGIRRPELLHRLQTEIGFPLDWAVSKFYSITIGTRLRLAAAIKFLSMVAMDNPFRIARSKYEAS